MKLSVVIPVYKKKDMFLAHLRQNMQYLRKHQVIVVDDASDEGIKEAVHKHWPEVTVITHTVNRGFGPAVNTGVAKAEGDLILLLNTDVVLKGPLPATVYDHFHDPSAFAVTFAQIERDGSVVGKNTITFSGGFPVHKRATNIDAGITAWAEAGSCIVRASYFRALHGFLPLYAPFYWEDTDLSYRAYCRGWYVKFEPAYVVDHHHESTIGTYFSQKKVLTVAFRNQLIFTWVNVSDTSLLFQHIMRLIAYCTRTAAVGNFIFFRGFIQALAKLPSIYTWRTKIQRYKKVGDKEVFSRLSTL